MNKKIGAIALLTAALAFQSVNAQLAKQKNITTDEVVKQLNELFAKGDDASKAQLNKEALALSQSKNESFAILAARVYQNLGQAEAADKINADVLKKFPKGIKARSAAFEKFIKEESTPAEEVEKQYHAWLKKFPEASFEKKSREIYETAKGQLATRFYNENNAEKGNQYINELKESENFPVYASRIASGLVKDKKDELAFPILEEGFNRSLAAKNSADAAIKVGTAARSYNSLVPLYTSALIKKGETDKGVKLLEEFSSTSPLAAGNANLTISLAQGYAKQGKNLDAFKVLENFLLKNGKNDDVIKEITPLYTSLNNSNSDFSVYATALDAKIKEVATEKYKSEMIKKEAPQFTLTNREGKSVSLADYKGKVVVIDFWATWCGPCKISFPGMQAAVNKYKDDKEVEFLFIDTWQREENYKDVVNKFITDNNYTFHVLFDEMKDNSKATTTAYGVKGIPHKVVIDKEGYIRFQSSGGSADVEKIVNEMSTKIELARKG